MKVERPYGGAESGRTAPEAERSGQREHEGRAGRRQRQVRQPVWMRIEAEQLIVGPKGQCDKGPKETVRVGEQSARRLMRIDDPLEIVLDEAVPHVRNVNRTKEKNENEDQQIRPRLP